MKKYVKCIDNCNGELRGITVGKIYELLYPDEDGGFVKNDRGSTQYYFSRRFACVDTPNGINAQGEPCNFDDSMLKPFQRVHCKNGDLYIIIGEINDLGICGFNKIQWTHNLSVDAEDEWQVVAVFAPPEKAFDYQFVEEFGRMIWKTFPENKTEKQIKELEEIIKEKQSELDKLKQSL